MIVKTKNVKERTGLPDVVTFWPPRSYSSCSSKKGGEALNSHENSLPHRKFKFYLPSAIAHHEDDSRQGRRRSESARSKKKSWAILELIWGFDASIPNFVTRKMNDQENQLHVSCNCLQLKPILLLIYLYWSRVKNKRRQDPISFPSIQTFTSWNCYSTHKCSNSKLNFKKLKQGHSDCIFWSHASPTPPP